MEQIDLTKRMIAKHPEMVFVKTAAEAKELMQKPHNTDFTIASSMGLESGHMIGSSQGLKNLVIRRYTILEFTFERTSITNQKCSEDF